MTDDENMSRALQALRETWDGTHDAPARSRSQILARAIQEQRRRRRVAFTVLPFAATFAVSIAWAAISGRLSTWIDSVRRDPATEPAPLRSAHNDQPAPQAQPTNSLELVAPQVADAEPPVASTPTDTVTPSKSAIPTPKTASSSAPGAQLIASAASAASVASAREQTLYTAAHRAHFVDHNSSSALNAWDSYLAEYPQGRFALEARYNRAISLVKLGRHAEGKRALEPFANGEFGSYRKSEARELLDALAGVDGGT